MKTVNQEYNCARKDLPHCIMWLGLTFDKIEITKEAPDWVWWQARSKYRNESFSLRKMRDD